MRKFTVLFVLLMVFSSTNAQIFGRKKKSSTNNKQTIKTEKVIEIVDDKVEIPEKIEDVWKVDLPKINREFRGAWIATVANINWPSKKHLTVAQQKEEAIYLLDLLEKHNFNAVIFQARPSADAFYQSKHEPWSYFLTGETGIAPVPFYDPLQFWIEEAHKRGMELHVWINPYRAHHSNGGKVSPCSIVKKMPENIVRLKNGMYWFDPSHKATQDHISKVIKDLVKRYDVDAVHFDDYFYPYSSYNQGADFPDHTSWNTYKSKGGTLSKSDWRRAHVNAIVKRIHTEIKTVKPWVKFGISPFGIWKPGYPEGVVGLNQYEELYADAKLWLNEGWVDYFAPQLYWPMESKRQNFTDLLRWWASENTHNRHLWPGLNTVEVKSTNRAQEIRNQINAANKMLTQSPGVIHWSIAGLTQNPTLLQQLKNDQYKEKALVPLSPWIKANKLEKPILSASEMQTNAQVSWSSSGKEEVFQWAVYTQYGNDWHVEILPKHIGNKLFPMIKNNKKLNGIAVKAIDRLGNESEETTRKM